MILVASSRIELEIDASKRLVNRIGKGIPKCFEIGY